MIYFIYSVATSEKPVQLVSGTGLAILDDLVDGSEAYNVEYTAS